MELHKDDHKNNHGKIQRKTFSQLVLPDTFQSLKEFLKHSTSKEVLVFDTNFLFVPFEFRVEIISEIEKILGNSVQFCIVEETLKELEMIEKKRDKNKKFLPLIATLLKRYNFVILTNCVNDEITYVDDILCLMPKKFVIATNDKLLKQRLWKIPKRVIFMRQMSYLDLK